MAQGARVRACNPLGAGAKLVVVVQQGARGESAQPQDKLHRGAEQVASAKRPLVPVQQALAELLRNTTSRACFFFFSPNPQAVPVQMGAA